MILLTLAWRNIWRNRRRTLLTMSTLALGLVVLLVFVGLGDGGHMQMIESAVRLGSGHVVFQAQGYQEMGGVERALTQKEQQSIRDWLEQNSERFPLRQIAPRVFASILGSSAEGSSGIQLVGIQPEIEAGVSRFSETLERGNFLSQEDEGKVLVGEGVAHKLDLDLGDKFVLMGQGAVEGEIESVVVRVKGIIRTGLEEYDQALVVSNLATAQDFLKLMQRVHQIAVLLQHEQQSVSMAREASQALPRVEVLDWQQALPELADFIRMDDGGNYVFHIFLFLLIAFMVLNTLLMSVLERSREFSLLEALGLVAWQRFVLVVLEGSLISLLAILAGLAVGLSLHAYLAIYGLPLDLFSLGEATVAGVAFDPVMYSYLSATRILGAAGLVFLMNLILALLAARRAAQPADMRLLGSH